MIESPIYQEIVEESERKGATEAKRGMLLRFLVSRFGAAAKELIPVRWLLSHQAGLPIVDGPLVGDEPGSPPFGFGEMMRARQIRHRLCRIRYE